MSNILVISGPQKSPPSIIISMACCSSVGTLLDYITINSFDSVGFDPKTVKKSGIGPKNIYSRVQLQSSTVDIDSKPGMGTVVAIHMPA